MLLWGLVVISAVDLALHVIPDELAWPLLFMGLLFSPFEPDLHMRVSGAAFGWVMMWGFMWLTGFMMGEDNVSWGDIILGTVVGAWIGLLVAPFALLAFCAIFALFSVPYIRKGEKGAPCAPSFSIALLAVAPFHDQILKIYG